MQQTDTHTDVRNRKQKRAALSKKAQRKKLTSPTAKIETGTPSSDYLTTCEAAFYVRLSRQFLEGARYRADGSGPSYLKVGRAVRYRRQVLDAWMATHDHASDKPPRK